MPATFSRTIRSLEADGSRRRVVELLIAVLLVAWASWFFLGWVTVYEVTDPGRARLEVTTTAHAVVAHVGGRVEKINFTIGQPVEWRAVLVILDSKDELLAIEKHNAMRDAAVKQRGELEFVISNEQKTLIARGKARIAAIKEADAQAAEAKASGEYPEKELARSKQLYARHSESLANLEKSTANATFWQYRFQTLKLAAVVVRKDRLVQECEGRTRLAELKLRAVELEGKAAIEEAEISQLKYEIEKRTIRAPVAGRVGEVVAKFQVGSVVNIADKLGAIVPDGKTRVVAQFPAASIGRIQPGQLGQLRLDGFPWTQYGTIPVKVAEVGNEASDGFIRVELAVAANSASPIPVGHGLQGSVEVAVEQVSPFILVLRAAGQFLGT
jgi:membrane fusion protein (multidrug efflux system)